MAFLTDSIVNILVTRPRFVVATSTTLCLLLASAALTVPAEMTFLSVLPHEDPLVKAYLAVDESARLSHRAILLLEGEDPSLDAALQAAVAAMRTHPEVDWVAIGDRARGAQLIAVSLKDDPMRLASRDIALGRTSFSLVEKAVESALSDIPVRIGWAGVPPQTIQDIEATMGRLMFLSPLSLLVVLALLLTVERRLLRVVSIAAPLGLAVLATFGVSAAVFGNITFNEGFFTVVVCGLGADFALHLIVRLREERATGRTFEDGLRRTFAGAGPAIVVGALTTAGAFTVLALAPEPLPRRLGVTGAAGMIICLALMFALLPALWALLERKSGTSSSATTFDVPVVSWLASMAVRRPRSTVAFSVLLVVTVGAGIGKLHYETDFNEIVNRDVPAAKVNARLTERFGVNSSPWLVATDTVAEAHRVHAAFREDPHFVRVEGAASVLASTATELPADTPPEVAAQLRGVDGRWLTWAFTTYAGLDTEHLSADRRRAQKIHPRAAGYGMFVEAIVAGKRPWAPWIALGVLAVVLAVLVVDLRSWRGVLLALMPPGAGMVCAAGMLGWLGIGVGIVHVVSVPLLLGLGVDDGLHVVHRLTETSTRRADEAAASVGRAMLVTTATTCATFTALLLSNNPSLESMALVILIGLPVCLLGAIALVPALAVLLRFR